MNRIIILILAWGPLVASSQQDSNPRQQQLPVSGQPRNVLSQQELQWLNNHYKTISGLDNDSAAGLIRKTFPRINEASVTAIISEAGRLIRSDKEVELARLRAILDGQRHEKQVLLKRITEKQFQYEKSTDSSRRKAMMTEINTLKKELASLESGISEHEAAVGKAERELR